MNDRAKPLQVLLIEDNPGDADLTADVLASLGLSLVLTVARDGDQALRLLDEGLRPRLVLLDLNLPRRSGQQVLEQLRADPRFKALPVVVLTSSTAAHDVRRCYELGANCYLTKPMGLVDFQALMRATSAFWFTQVQLPQ